MQTIDKLSVATLVAEVGAVVLSPDFRDFLTANILNLLALAPAGLSALRLLYSQMPVEHPPGVDTLKM